MRSLTNGLMVADFREGRFPGETHWITGRHGLFKIDGPLTLIIGITMALAAENAAGILSRNLERLRSGRAEELENVVDAALGY